MTVTPCPWAIAVATWTRASNTRPGTSTRRPSAPTRAGLGSGTATPRRASSATKSTTSASCAPSMRYVVASPLAARVLISAPLCYRPSTRVSLNEKNVNVAGLAGRLRKLALVLGGGSGGQLREVGGGAAVDLGNRVGVVAQRGGAAAAVAEAGGGECLQGVPDDAGSNALQALSSVID